MKYLIALVIVALSSNGYSLERFSGDGEAFDFSIEIIDGEATLYIAEKPTNKPMTATNVRFVLDDEEKKPLDFKKTERAGIYTLTLGDGKLPDGSVEVGENSAEAYSVDSGSHGGHDHDDHAHGGTPSKNLPSWMIALLGSFIGILLGGIGAGLIRRKQATAIIAISLFAAFSGQDLQAGGGHAHGEAKISDAPIGSEIQMNKRSQFLVGLRTVEANIKDHENALSTYGHVIAKPSLDALVTAPRSGFVSGNFDSIWGKKVKKGDLLATIESVGKIRVRAPIDGTVVKVSAVSGMRVDQGAPLFRVVGMKTLWVDAEIFQSDLESVQSKTGSALVSVDGSSKSIKAKITGAMSGVDENTLTAKVYLEIDNSNSNIQLGSAVSISIPMQKGVLEGAKIPKKAVLNRGGETLVFVQTDAELFESRAVAVSNASSPEYSIITDGLEEGDRVVVTGNYQLLVGAH